jgi:hypothetical protein
MRRPSIRLVGTFLIAGATIGCGAGQYTPVSDDATLPPGNHGANGIVLAGAALDDHGGTLLSFLFMRMSGMTVDRSTYPCPSIQLRGRKSLFGSNSPVIYVDGVRTANSCVLEMLNTRDLTRVEVYPMGVSLRPGYEAHPNGLILVFVKDGSEPRESQQAVALSGPVVE